MWKLFVNIPWILNCTYILFMHYCTFNCLKWFSVQLLPLVTVAVDTEVEYWRLLFKKELCQWSYTNCESLNFFTPNTLTIWLLKNIKIKMTAHVLIGTFQKATLTQPGIRQVLIPCYKTESRKLRHIYSKGNNHYRPLNPEIHLPVNNLRNHIFRDLIA